MKFNGHSGGATMWGVALLCLFFCSCLRNEVKVEFALAPTVGESCELDYYASDSKKGWYVQTAAIIDKGRGEIIVRTKNPTLVFMTVNSDQPQAAFYAERGDDIKIEGESSSPYDWKISGNKINEEWTAWRLANKQVLMARNDEGINSAVAKYVKGNPEKPLSAILLMVYYNRRIDEIGFSKLFKTLKGDAADSEWVALVNPADVAMGGLREGEPVKNIILSTAGTGCDTLTFGGKPMILYFWRNHDNNRRDGIEVLQRLRLNYPDSSRRILADISFDADSVSWRYSLDMDSLNRVVRGWNPLGELDSVMTRLNVPRTPYFIVVDKRGKVVYRGDDASASESAFKRLLPKN